MFGRRKNKYAQQIIVMRSGKRYRVDTRKRYLGQDLKTFVDTYYSPVLSEREEIHHDNREVTSQYSLS